MSSKSGRSIAIIYLLLLVLAVTVETILTEKVYMRIMDEDYYISSGIRYIKDPRSVLTINWEHPPLAKYMIGLSTLWLGRLARVTVYLVGVMALILFYLLVNSLSIKAITKHVVVVLFSLDLIYAHVIRYMMLDVYMLTFMLASLYFYVKWLRHGKIGHFILLSLFAGLALSSKWPTVYMIIPMILVIMLKARGLRGKMIHIVAFTGIVATVYIATYVPALSSGVPLYEIVLLQLKMVNYHMGLHPYVSFASLNSIMLFFLKLSFWEVFSGPTFYLYSNGTVVKVGEFVREGWKVYFYFGYGNIGWWLFLPALLHVCYTYVKGLAARRYRWERALFLLLSLSSVSFLLHGDLEWYYFDILPVFYVILGFALDCLREKWLYLIVVVSAMFSALVLFSGRYYLAFNL